jgi:hypothetical protein
MSRAPTTLARAGKAWLPMEDHKLRFLWGGEESLEAISRALQRPHSGIISRAFELGLPFGPPPGCEGLYAARQRTGYSSRQIRAVLAHAGVKLTPARTAPVKGRARQRCFYVEIEEVNRAVAAWNATEAVAAAAKRRGIHPDTLRRWLKEASAPGVKSSAGARAHWRVRSEVVDQVVGERQARKDRSRLQTLPLPAEEARRAA